MKKNLFNIICAYDSTGDKLEVELKTENYYVKKLIKNDNELFSKEITCLMRQILDLTELKINRGEIR